jgi:hypothetical protein
MIASLSAFGVIIVVIMEDNILLAVVLVPVPVLAMLVLLLLLVMLVPIIRLPSALLVLVDKT